MQAPPVSPPEPPKRNNAVLIIVVVLLVGFCFIVPIIAAVLFPVFSQARLSARKSASMSEARTIAMGLLMYASDNDDRLPPSFRSTSDLEGALAGWVDTSDIDFKSANPAGSEFVPNANAEGLPVSSVLDPGTAVLIYELGRWSHDGGRVVAYFSGEAEYSKTFDEATGLEIRLQE
jgi:hypothetical protein